MTDPKDIQPQAETDAEATTTFAALDLSEAIMRALDESGYTTPTPIQAQAIPLILSGMDVTGIAQTGTGKTGAFVLPMISQLSKGRARARMSRCMILCPTRELAAQVSQSFEKYGKHLKLTMALLIGGVSFKEQEKLLLRGVDVLIATPGRLIDQFERGKILLTGVETLIIDEADRMLDMGFVPDIEKICGLLPKKRQTLLFSATMPPEIARLAEKFQKIPVTIEASRPSQTADTIKQYVVPISVNSDKARRTALRRVIESCDVSNGIIFCNRKMTVDVVAKSLKTHGFDAAAIHGDLAQSLRTETLEAFRAGSLKLLVASDVAARGLDVPDVSHVFNYSPPPKDEDYVHRIGRTGRAGRSGESYTIVSGSYDEKAWESVLKLIGKEVENFTIDGLEDELAKLPSDKDKPRGKGRGRERERGGRGRPSPTEAKSQPPTQPTKPAPRRDGPKPDVQKAAIEPTETAKAVKPKLDDTPKPDTPKREARPRKTNSGNGNPSLGFGQDVPSFFNAGVK